MDIKIEGTCNKLSSVFFVHCTSAKIVAYLYRHSLIIYHILKQGDRFERRRLQVDFDRLYF